MLRLNSTMSPTTTIWAILILILCPSSSSAEAKQNPPPNRRGAVVGVVGRSAEIPCEATPSSKRDAPYLILWYKDIFGTPIYR